jgi:hypothetical protein
LLAHFGKGHASADIRDRANLDRLDEPFEHIVGQLDLLVVEAAGGGQKEIGDAPGGFRRFSAEPIFIAASTSSTIDRSASSIARPEPIAALVLSQAAF